MSYWKLYYHVVWTTFDRQPLINLERAAIIRAALYIKAKKLRAVLHAVGNVTDHVHVVASFPPMLSVSAYVKHLKGATSRAVHVRTGASQAFRWQEGYGALSLGERSLATVVAYVRDQPRHHRERTVLDVYERSEAERARQQSSSDDFFAP